MKLTVKAGAKVGTEIPLKKEKFVIGRASECTLRAGSEAISRQHCLILKTADGFTIRDLGSRNGTYVNGDKIGGETPLAEGDDIRVGPLELTFHAAKTAVAKPKGMELKEAVNRTAPQSGDTEFEEDISRWLVGPDPGPAAMRETQTFRMDDTHAGGAGGKLPGETKPAEGSSGDLAGTEAAESPKDGKGKKTPGKLPAMMKKQTKDSREAANEILRDIARRR